MIVHVLRAKDNYDNYLRNAAHYIVNEEIIVLESFTSVQCERVTSSTLPHYRP